jgi:hypothetical protein
MVVMISNRSVACLSSCAKVGGDPADAHTSDVPRIDDTGLQIKT